MDLRLTLFPYRHIVFDFQCIEVLFGFAKIVMKMLKMRN